MSTTALQPTAANLSSDCVYLEGWLRHMVAHETASNEGYHMPAKQVDVQDPAYNPSTDDSHLLSSTSSTEAHLTSMVHAFFDAVNTRTLTTNPLEIKGSAHPCFTASYAYDMISRQGATSFPEHIDHWQQLLIRYPEFRIHKLNISADVDEIRGAAVVYVDERVTGIPDGITEGLSLAGMVVYEWERSDGRWLCWRVTMLKGLNEVT